MQKSFFRRVTRRCAAIVACAWLVTISAVSAGAASNDDLRKAIDDLQKIISKLPKEDAAKDAALQKSIKDLTGALQDVTKPAVSSPNDNDGLRKQFEILKNILVPFPKSGDIDPKLKDALNALAEALEQTDCNLFPTAAADCFVKVVTEALTNLQKTAKKLSGKQAAAITSILGPLLPASDPTSLIRIHRALYGDLQFIGAHLDHSNSKYPVQPLQGPDTAFNPYAVLNRNEPQFFDTKRMCSATQAIRAICHGQPACLTTSEATPSRTGIQLCGYEPAPYAEPMHRGLVVEYDCQSSDSFDASTPPPPPTPVFPIPTKIVQVRVGETARIFCSEASK